MVVTCAAYGCSNHNKMENKLGFFRIPNNDPELRKKWIQACKRMNKDGSPWNPNGKNVYLCGRHFITGKPVKNDPSHPDYIPSIFIYNKSDVEKDERKVKRYQSRLKRDLAAASSLTSTLVASGNACLEPSEVNMENNDIGSPITGLLEAKVNFNKRLFEDVSPSQLVSSPHSSPPPIDFVLCSTPTSHEAASQTDMTSLEIEQLNFELQSLRKERDEALTRLSNVTAKFLSYDNLLSKPPSKFTYYTGISRDIFDNIYDFIEPSLPNVCKNKLSYKDQLLMTLVKLRLDIQFENLGDQFNCCRSSVALIFKKWIDLIFHKLSFLIKYPDHDASVLTLPHVFRQYFPKLTAIIDCTEIFIDRPRNLKARAQVYSNYKKHSTVKFLIACTPHGSISYISQAWGGRVSDVELVKNSGFISSRYHHPGDQILADRGFTLVDEFAAGCGAELIIPSFTKGKKQLSAREVEVSRQIASIRIHIERVIGAVKNRYHILDGPIPIPIVQSLSSEVSGSDVSSIDKLFTVCCILTNLGEGIVYKE